jgi:transposase-like protein
MADFAAQAGVSAWTLYQWRRRLSCAAKQHEAPSPRLVEVAVVQETPGASSRLCVHLRTGHRVEVPCNFDTADLRWLIGVLESC